MRRPIVFVIDVEPDGRSVLDRDHGWDGTNAALDPLARLRGDLEAATGARVRFNWFLRTDPQIAGTWGRADVIADACPALLRAIENHNDYRGIHVHLWRPDATRGTWFSDLTDPAWLEECVTSSADAFTSIFGHRPHASRVGDHWLSEGAVAAIRSIGIRVDLTVEPGLPAMPVYDDPQATGRLPDFTQVPRTPYVPLGNDFRAASSSSRDDGLWMLPVTTSAPTWRLLRRPPFVVRTSRALNLVLDPTPIWSGLRAAFDTPTHHPIVIVMRSGDLSQRRYLDNFLKTTTRLARHPALPHCEFVSAEEALGRWRSERATS
jgi:hypothetical protein